jgi:16S rRNA A1518/A1519 N6-dimethyltransferase RsmA/KsgA/DIM1 with predicted DNA glycosylase/AP lyase activity
MKFTLEFDEQQLTILDRAVAELPYKIAAPLVQSINQQLKTLQDARSQKSELGASTSNILNQLD